MTFNISDLGAVAPEIAVLVVAMVVIAVELFKVRSTAALQTIAVIGLVVVMAVVVLSMVNRVLRAHRGKGLLVVLHLRPAAATTTAAGAVEPVDLGKMAVA